MTKPFLRITVLAAGLSLTLPAYVRAAPDPGATPPVQAPQSSALKDAPGYNIHIVSQTPGQLILRGGAPTKGTLQWLTKLAKDNKLPLTMVDLRTPARSYDLNREGNRLPPNEEKSILAAAGHTHLPLSALDKQFPQKVSPLLAGPGIVYFHCQYGVNRTGFAIGRLSKMTGKSFDRTGLGDRDFKQGFNYQQ